MLPDNNEKHIDTLDGVRGLAIIIVICFHYFPTVKIFSSGWVGVDLFFALSGYLITGRLLNTLQNKNYFLNFYRNRVLRIFPLYYLLLIVFYSAVYFLSKDENRDGLTFFTTHWKSFFFFTDNWTFIFYGLPHLAYLNHLWSLAMEEQFYLIWPLVVYYVSPEKWRLQIWGGIFMAVILARFIIYTQFGAGDWHMYYFNTVCRMDAFVIGAILCHWQIARPVIPRIWVSRITTAITVLIICCIFLFQTPSCFIAFKRIGGYSCIAVLCAALIHLALGHQRYIIHFFGNRLIRYAGKISYGLYLFHWPVLLVVGTRITNWGLFHYPDKTALFYAFSVIFCFLLTFLLSAVSFRFFESWFLKFKK